MILLQFIVAKDSKFTLRVGKSVKGDLFLQFTALNVNGKNGNIAGAYK